MPEEHTMDFTRDYQQAIRVAQNWFDTVRPGLNASLADYLYAEWYTKSHYNKPDVQYSSAMLVNAFNAAARAAANWQTGWGCVRQLDLNCVEAVRKDERRYLYTSEYINRSCPGKIPAPGDALKVISYAASDQLLEGYWVVNSGQWQYSSARMLRVYWNISSEGAALLARALISAMPGNMAYSLKLPLEADGYLRTDAAVLYFYVRDLGTAMPAIHHASQELANLLYTETPRLCKPVARGIGLAEEPAVKNQSFGSSRCQILASALQRAHTDGVKQSQAMMAIIRQELIKASVDPEKPYKISRNIEQGRSHEC